VHEILNSVVHRRCCPRNYDPGRQNIHVNFIMTFHFEVSCRQERRSRKPPFGSGDFVETIRKRYTSPHRFPHTVHHFVMANEKPTKSTRHSFATGARATCKGTSQPGFMDFFSLASLVASARNLWCKTPYLPHVIYRAQALARASPYSDKRFYLFLLQENPANFGGVALILASHNKCAVFDHFPFMYRYFQK
jgi:hypothetical protein